MTPEQQRIAIAEACPQAIRKNTSPAGYWEENPCWEWFDGSWWSQCHNNDPLNDLNAMHEAEKVLKTKPNKRNGQVWRYLYEANLSRITGGEPVSATAAQRARAFLETLNLWKL